MYTTYDILRNSNFLFIENYSDFKGSISLLITGDEEGVAINGTKKVVEYLKKRKVVPIYADTKTSNYLKKTFFKSIHFFC